MQLSYRGVPYPMLNPSLETTETATSAKFRGVAYTLRRPIGAPPSTPYNLMYRGAFYYPQCSLSIPTIAALG